METAVVVPEGAKSGVRTVADKLIQGLLADGIEVKVFSLRNNNVMTLLFSDMISINRLRKFRNVIYIGSFAWLSHLVIRSRTLLFVHGFVDEELKSMICKGSIRAKIFATILKANWVLTRMFDVIDAYACHSLTSKERNKLPAKTMVIPQFMLSKEMTEVSVEKGTRKDDWFRIVTYRSHSDSPRLMTWNELVSLASLIEQDVVKKFEMDVLDPYSGPKEYKRIKVVPFLPKEAFLDLVQSSSLYLERCKDEELGFGSLESALEGTPVAKVTVPDCVGRQDYSADQVVFAESIAELARIVARLIDDGSFNRTTYSEKMMDFIKSLRTWDEVKMPLIRWVRQRG